jgi:hypothetical protein
MAYTKAFLDAGGVYSNVKNIAAHWLYGSDVTSIAKLSQHGIVYNPPGH